MKEKKLILVTNDDGVDSPGIRMLAKAMRKIPNTRVVVVAPDREKSAASHALTIHSPLRITKKARDFYAVDGTPTDSVMLGVHVVLKQTPDLIVSGINKGANLGEDVHYSGTVSAALEGGIMGIPSIAFSVVALDNFNFEAAGLFATKIAKKVLAEGLPKGVVLNVNIPNKHRDKIRGHKMTKLGKHNYGDMTTESIDPRGRAYYWIGGDPHKFEAIADSDCEAFSEDKISVTPINVDLTDYAFLKKMNKWKI